MPDGALVLLGDNSAVSVDSRTLGFFPHDRILPATRPSTVRQGRGTAGRGSAASSRTRTGPQKRSRAGFGCLRTRP
ncbi:S26 family signal peptidase [Streptomyces lancefieldiae]|uniref:S26 family signal peptidase n=1 Tax=Streptomyces lancefieldiae TaxID=3075520 RepID=A0ABU3AFP1_9ACTN|nr:S26 family signal peptidase [Streptomyces sp. DSM 40712]MDT0608991.1 S26 family signal peptidase [Streptomyces sp. DSM 40712]